MATNVITPNRADLFAGAASMSPPAGPLARLARWLAEHRRYRATVRELSALDDELLADIGVVRSEIDAVAHRVAAHGRWR